MKNSAYIVILLILTSLIFSSCEEDVFPKGPLQESYVLNCLLDGNSTRQVAFLSRTYDVEGYDPHDNLINPAVTDAEVSLIYDGNTYYFRDTVVAETPQSRYPGNQYYYYIDNFFPEANKVVTIQAKLKNGTVIRSEITTFPKRLLRGSFYRSDQLVPPEDPTQTTLLFKWGDYTENVYFISKFTIEYSRTINGVEQFYSKEIPQMIEGSGPAYPSVSIGDKIIYELEAFQYAFESIAEEGVPLEEYKIYNAKFTLLIPDEPLATYYSAAKTFSDSYSISLTEPEYTNIEGGLGVFGSYIIYELPVTINRSYIEAFGYTSVAAGD